MSSSALVEKLIQTVSRAFYPDNVILIFDALIREKFIREEELGPRLKLPNKEIRKILCQLQEEMLVKSEDIQLGNDTKLSRCWYIDYYLFTLVVRYRIHRIKTEILKNEKLELNHIFFQCPSCHEKYSELQIQRLISKDYKFICSHCCPSNDFNQTMSQPYFTLIELDTSKQLNVIQKLEKKMTSQWTQSEYHEGIFDLLAELRNEYIIRNLPSDNIKRGLMTSRVTDEEVLQRIEENSSSGRKRKGASEQMGGVGVGLGGGFTVEVAEGDILLGNNSTNQAINGSCGVNPGDMLVPQRQKALPSFLSGSRIITNEIEVNGEEKLAEVEEREEKNGEVEDDDDDEWED
jgi:transcription initiation factor IIE alpha subunit